MRHAFCVVAALCNVMLLGPPGMTAPQSTVPQATEYQPDVLQFAEGARHVDAGNDSYTQLTLESGQGRAGRAVFKALPPGRYAVTFRVSAGSPFAASKERIAFLVQSDGAPDTWRHLTGADMRADGAATSVTVHRYLREPGTIRTAVRWDHNQDGGLEVLRVHDIELKRVDRGVAIGTFQSRKLIYAPAATGQIDTTLHNVTDEAINARMRLTLTGGVNRTISALNRTVALKPNESRQLTIEFECPRRRFGYEARLTLTRDGETLDQQRDYFNVHDNIWPVGLGSPNVSAVMSHSGRANEGDIKRGVRKMRATYSNWWEKMFWAPDDWGDLTPQRDEWMSGQSARHESAAMIKQFIERVKPMGIRSITYGKHVATGPHGWELVRRHPEWFHRNRLGQPSGQFHTWDLAHWHDIDRHMGRDSRDQYHSSTWAVGPDFRQKRVLDYGIDELIASAKRFGWDGVRFDGHWSAGNDALSTANMRRMKEALWQFDDDFAFGFNYSYTFGHHGVTSAKGRRKYPHELREAMAGGGMFMQEAIRGFAYAPGQRYNTWRQYATRELASAQQVRRRNGSYYFIYGLGKVKPIDQLYKFVLGTAAGAHPTYGAHAQAPGAENWGRFLTRASGFVWDTDLRPIEAEKNVTVKGADRLWWRPWLRERIVSERRRHVIVHLINPPRHESLDTTSSQLPSPARDVTVRVRVPEGQTVRAAALLDPARGPVAHPLNARQDGAWHEMNVPAVRHWAMVVLSLTGDFAPPEQAPRFTEPADAQRVAAGRKAEIGGTVFDPTYDKPASGTQAAQRWQYETDQSYNSVPALDTKDPKANNGRAQIRPAGKKHVYIGRTWMGPLPPGRYVAKLRIRLDDDADQPRPQHVGMRVLIRHEGQVLRDDNVTLGTAHHDVADRHTLSADGEYHEYPIGFEIDRSAHINLIGGARTARPSGDHRLLMDRIVLEQKQRFTDAGLQATRPLPVPEGVSVGGEEGLDVLLVKGWTWQAYRLDTLRRTFGTAARIDERWVKNGRVSAFPASHEAMFDYDVVILANVDATGFGYERRKIVRDFVHAGGGLVLLGGMHTLGQGRFEHTFLAQLMPVVIDGPGEVRRAERPLRLRPRDHDLFDGLDVSWTDRPVLYWRHHVTPRETATVLMHAGKHPIMVTQTIGSGRVLAFTGTALGTGNDARETRPFWVWKDWPTVLARLVRGARATENLKGE